MEIEDTAVACSLGPVDIQNRRKAWTDFLASNFVERRVIPGGIRLVLRPAPDTAARLRRLIELENACCAWIKWSIIEGAPMEVDATADQGSELLRDWFGLTPTGA